MRGECAAVGGASRQEIDGLAEQGHGGHLAILASAKFHWEPAVTLFVQAATPKLGNHNANLNRQCGVIRPGPGSEVPIAEHDARVSITTQWLSGLENVRLAAELR